MDYLTQLLQCCGPSAFEGSVSAFFRQRMSSVADKIEFDNMGNTVATFNPDGSFHLLLSAHIDEIGFQVCDYNKNGLLKIRKVGGVRKQYINAQRVKVLAAGKSVDGVVVCKYDDKEGLPDIDGFFVDIDAGSREEAQSIAPLGTPVCFAPNVTFSGNTVTSKSLDDRIGIYTITRIATQLADRLESLKLSVAATVQEEIGLRGMASVAKMVPADVCLNFDVTDAAEFDKESLPSLGGGAVLFSNADSNTRLRDELAAVADYAQIPHQLSLGRNITGGTDAARLQIFSPDAAVAGIGLPCRYMHSPVEKCSLLDVNAAVSLVVSFAENLEKRLAAGGTIDFRY